MNKMLRQVLLLAGAVAVCVYLSSVLGIESDESDETDDYYDDWLHLITEAYNSEQEDLEELQKWEKSHRCNEDGMTETVSKALGYRDLGYSELTPPGVDPWEYHSEDDREGKWY